MKKSKALELFKQEQEYFNKLRIERWYNRMLIYTIFLISLGFSVLYMKFCNISDNKLIYIIISSIGALAIFSTIVTLCLSVITILCMNDPDICTLNKEKKQEFCNYLYHGESSCIDYNTRIYDNYLVSQKYRLESEGYVSLEKDKIKEKYKYYLVLYKHFKFLLTKEQYLALKEDKPKYVVFNLEDLDFVSEKYKDLEIAVNEELRPIHWQDLVD